MRIRIYIAGLILAGTTGNAFSAEPAQVQHRGFKPSYAHISDCATSPKVLDATFREYFEGHDNIFEGTVLSTGPRPYGGPIVNLCWAEFKVNKWYRTTLNQQHVPVLFETELKPGTGLNSNEPVQCPVKVGDALLIFAGEPSDEEVDNLFMHTCSHYLPLKDASYLRRLLGMWEESIKWGKK